ncbi:MAG: gamma-glutamyl-gamma-aminobutyrate hydrolase family protein [Gemmataceae bacterium]|nr:gamma-glutamyl-gamma-aminobutyrate hydrolase family protein [Gemmataceae bacterium]
MSAPAPTSSIRIGIYGMHGINGQESRGFGLWPAGYPGAVAHSGATPVVLPLLAPGESWKELLHGLDGIVFSDSTATTTRPAGEEDLLVRYCRDYQVPLLAVDFGMHVLNTTFGGTLYNDLPRELPEALQHRHPPERGLRHAINVLPGTHLASLYGEGEVVVNSEHRRAVQRLGRGFKASALALDGVVEAIEPEKEGWWVLGVQWHPASVSASGLDIQVFRGLIQACELRTTREQGAEAACHAA